MPEPERTRDREDSVVEDDGRRRLLLGVCGAAGAAVAAALLAPPVGLLLRPAARLPAEAWRKVVPASALREGETVTVRIRDPDPFPWAGFAADNAVHLRRDEEEGLIALSAYCTHVGCPVRWVPGARMFMCPCHGGAFFEDGTVAAGPPARPLERHPVRVREGLVEISTRRRPARRSGRA